MDAVATHYDKTDDDDDDNDGHDSHDGVYAKCVSHVMCLKKRNRYIFATLQKLE